MSDDTPRDRRHAARTDLILKVEYAAEVGQPADYVTDLSEEGMFVCTTAPFFVGQHLEVRLSFPGLLEARAFLVEVVRVVRPDALRPDAPSGVGVRFRLRTADERAALRELLARLDTGAAPPPPRPFRVLLVEDNDFAHKLFHHAVKRFHCAWGHGGALVVESAKDGREALELLRGDAVHLALVDFFLPVMNGAQLIRRMRADARTARIPILVISVGGAGVREEAMAAGADLYLDKPVLLKQLVTTLQALLADANQATREPEENHA